jgi:ABC-2 type transport system ATP-binding protein
VAESVAKRYGLGPPVLSGVDLEVPTGSIYALLGRNGTGKTTLLRIALGVYRASRGRVRIFGRDPRRDPAAVLSRVAYVPDGLTCDTNLRVREMLELLSRLYPRWDHAYCYQLLARFELAFDTRLREMSRGLQTKVMLVGALAQRPDLLILDDPTLGLDAVVLDEFFQVVREASRRDGTTVLISSHQLEELETTATHVAFLRDGRIALNGALETVRRGAREVTVQFAAEVPSLAGVDGFRVVRTSACRVTGVVLDSSSGALDRLRALGPAEMRTRDLTLKEIFVHLLR